MLQRDADGTALLEARPLTGRTNQIRIHLWHLGFPVCGDQVYLPGKKVGDTATVVTPNGNRELEILKLITIHDEAGD